MTNPRIALAGSRVDTTLKVLLEGGVFRLTRERPPGLPYYFGEVTVARLYDVRGSQRAGVSLGTLRTFRRAGFVATVDWEFPKYWSLTECGRGFALARKLEDRFGVWGSRPPRRGSIKAFVERRLAEGQRDALALVEEVSREYPFKCGGYGYVSNVKRQWERRAEA